MRQCLSDPSEARAGINALREIVFKKHRPSIGRELPHQALEIEELLHTLLDRQLREGPAFFFLLPLVVDPIAADLLP